MSLDNYFDKLEHNRLVDQPYLIINIDKTGMPLDLKPLKVVKRGGGHKNLSQVSGGVKTQITLVGYVITGGQCLPCMVIWNCKNSQHPSCLTTGPVYLNLI